MQSNQKRLNDIVDQFGSIKEFLAFSGFGRSSLSKKRSGENRTSVTDVLAAERALQIYTEQKISAGKEELTATLSLRLKEAYERGRADTFGDLTPISDEYWTLEAEKAIDSIIK